MLLLIDNYDSFTYNLAQYFGELGQELRVLRNDAVDLAGIAALAPDYLVISPGPCTPNEAGVSLAAIGEFAGKIPLLGVCLGHQAMGQAFGGKVVRARQVMHGKTSPVHHDGRGLFAGLAEPTRVCRYHSLIVERGSLPACLRETAWTLDGAGERDEIMALAHETLPLWGVQFHPEAILTAQGHELLANFLHLGQAWREQQKGA